MKIHSSIYEIIGEAVVLSASIVFGTALGICIAVGAITILEKL